MPNDYRPKHRNVRFSLDQLEELRYMVSQYLNTEGPAYEHAISDFRDWLHHLQDEVTLELGPERLREEGSKSIILPVKTPCVLCGGDPARTPGGCRCKECLVIGTQPWGG